MIYLPEVNAESDVPFYARNQKLRKKWWFEFSSLLFFSIAFFVMMTNRAPRKALFSGSKYVL